MFVKRGVGKILSIVNDDELSEIQKESVNDMSKELIKQDELADSSNKKKKSGS